MAKHSYELVYLPTRWRDGHVLLTYQGDRYVF